MMHGRCHSPDMPHHTCMPGYYTLLVTVHGKGAADVQFSSKSALWPVCMFLGCLRSLRHSMSYHKPHVNEVCGMFSPGYMHGARMILRSTSCRPSRCLQHFAANRVPQQFLTWLACGRTCHTCHKSLWCRLLRSGRVHHRCCTPRGHRTTSSCLQT